MKRAPQLTRAQKSSTTAAMLEDTGATPREIHDVFKLSDGRLKVVGVKHDKRLGMILPECLATAWTQAAQDRGITKTDLFETLLLEYLKKNGWKIGA